MSEVTGSHNRCKYSNLQIISTMLSLETLPCGSRAWLTNSN